MASTRSCAEPFGMYTTAFCPSCWAARATPRPWLPSVVVAKVIFFDGGFQGIKREGVNIETVFFTQQLGDGVGAAEHFEGVEAKALGFIFYRDVLYAEQRRQFLQGI